MQTFIDTETQQQYIFDDDVVVSQDADGHYVFTTAGGVLLDSLPTTLQPCTPPPVDPNIEILGQLKGQAAQALNASDITVLRLIELNSNLVPADWVAYRSALRAVLNTTSTTPPLPTVPTRPVYPPDGA